MPLRNFNKHPRPHSLIQSVFIKLAVFSIGAALVLWFGWSVPQANQQRFYSSQSVDVPQDVKNRVSSLSLDINQGTKEELQALPGIGPVLASRIIDHRASKGLFADIEDLKAIPGIGETTLAQLRPYITVNQPTKVESQKRPSSS
jgi:competence protein ComEA